MGKLFKLGTEGKGKRARQQTRGDWHCKIKLAPYQFKRARLCTDKATSESWATMLQAAVDRKNAGEPPDPEVMKRLPRRLLESFGLISALSAKRRGTYASNAEDFVQELKTAGRDAKYTRNIEKYLTLVGDACGWRRLADIGRDAFTKYLQDRKDGGTAPRTLNNITTTVNGFCRWAVQAKRMDANPIEHVKRVDQTADRRRKRRALATDEVKRLLAIAGRRELVYRLALGTGLRLRELRRLQWRDVVVDEVDRPCLSLRAEATKSKRADMVPLPAHLVNRLRAARPDGFSPTDRVFKTVPTFDTWCRDLERAKIDYRSDDDTVAGFHSLRVTFCSELERRGVSPRTIMELARHRDYRLTASVYTDVRVIDTFGAVGKLPAYDETPEQDAQVARRTGTDDAPVRLPKEQDQIRDQKRRSNVQKRSIPCNEASPSADVMSQHDSQKTPGFPAFSSVSGQKENARKPDVSPPRVGLEPTT